MSRSFEDVYEAIDFIKCQAAKKVVKSKPRLCELCGDKAVGKYLVEQENDNVGGWVKVCRACKPMVEMQGFEVEVYKYCKGLEPVQFIVDCDHDWKKYSLVTEDGGFDWMKCNTCGWFGKRYGLGGEGVTELTKELF
ncbi:MAG: hypothetical protein MI976_11465 [Pseudomonadales bacterium]|nr:hypothetical protein [Pseudomonadales bacterium]